MILFSLYTNVCLSGLSLADWLVIEGRVCLYVIYVLRSTSFYVLHSPAYLFVIQYHSIPSTRPQRFSQNIADSLLITLHPPEISRNSLQEASYSLFRTHALCGARSSAACYLCMFGLSGVQDFGAYSYSLYTVCDKAQLPLVGCDLPVCLLICHMAPNDIYSTLDIRTDGER